MIRVLLPLPVLLPLLAAGLSIVLGRHPTLQRALSLLTLLTTTATSGVLLALADRDGVQVVQAGGWAAPAGISLVGDRLSTLLLVVSQLVLLAVLLYAIGQGVADGSRTPRAVFHPCYLVLGAGIALAFLTGDLFNLFVGFEVMLVASYVLLTLGGGAAQVQAGMTYVVVSLLASVLFVTVVGLVYAATGTVNMADAAERLQDVPEGVRVALGLTMLVVFGIKAAVFPLFSWLPDSYPTAPSPVTAVFAGLLTKVGVYAIIRTQTLLFPRDETIAAVLLVLAVLTMVVGILGAVVQDDVKRVLSFTIVSHIGYMLLGLGLASAAGLAGAVLYTVHHIVVQTTLFLVAGLIERRDGTSSLARSGGLQHVAPLLAVLYLLPALSLAGIPPLSGFVAKIGLIQAGLADGGGLAVTGVVAALLTSLLTLYAVGRVWTGVFWGPVAEVVPDADTEDDVDVGVARTPRLMTAATGAAVVGGLLITVVAGPLYALSARAADDLLERGGYVQAVLRPGGREMILLLWLTVVWVGLWGSVTPANVLGGLLLGAVLVTVLPVREPAPRDRVSPVGLLRFLGVFLVALVQSSLQVAGVVLRRRTDLHPAVIAVPVSGEGDRLLTLVANSISLTPGTLTLEVDRDRRLLYVHVLDVGAGATGLPAVRRGIEQLDRAAARALPPS